MSSIEPKPLIGSHAFNAAFAAAQLAASIESSGTVDTSERIAAAAVGIADAEADGVDWGQVLFDGVIGKAADAIEASLRPKEMGSDDLLDALRIKASGIVKGQVK